MCGLQSGDLYHCTNGRKETLFAEISVVDSRFALIHFRLADLLQRPFEYFVRGKSLEN